MWHPKFFPSALLSIAIGLPQTVQATGASPQGVSIELVREKPKYPNPPKKLEGDPATSAVLLMDFDLKGELGNSRVDGAALVRVGDSVPILAAPIRGDLVMFHALEPGTYRLMFMHVLVYIGGDLQPREVLGQVPTLDITASVGSGGIHYVGTVAVSRKLRLLGSRPLQFQLVDDARRESEAWAAFKKKYASSPWSALADGRILALRSPGQGQVPAIAPVAPEGRDSAKGADDPFSKLAGDWGLTVFVMGAGQFSGLTCGKGAGPGGPPVTIAPPSDGAVSLAVACEGGSEYRFHLRRDSATQAYALTVQSTPGISVQDFPVAYVEGKGWRGEREQMADGETQSVTAMVEPIEGRNWYGWMIAVLPTAGIARSDDLKKPYFRTDLTRRK